MSVRHAVGLLLLLAAGLGPALSQVEPPLTAEDSGPAAPKGEPVVVVEATTDEAEVAATAEIHTLTPHDARPVCISGR